MPTTPHKILVHTCCTACASHVFPELENAGFKVVPFFYNPQIDLSPEYTARLDDLKMYCEDAKLELIIPNYEPKEFVEILTPFKNKESLKYISDKDRFQRRRCALCNSLVIQRTIEQSKRLRIKYFTTTLLCSPYKDHGEIIEIANEKALDYNLNFYYQDFRKGYWKGRNFARNHEIYAPGFCGCSDSLKEKRLE
ncbi:MAG: epoxyqueuosine reductase QueH [Candidatus Berkelbacteria bacterium]|nr:epoxyqueuosine reductase QueH [Candidatus Berkelbacteria bacterium]